MLFMPGPFEKQMPHASTSKNLCRTILYNFTGCAVAFLHFIHRDVQLAY